ncbi:MAG: 4Fe-4S dicluster domain-containing protein [Candidatus Firestonebacteria bacterium]|nr:4Fe-4S dicluster domain-containing protein [Candidatus Firestonebacteria bacterium]
MSTEFWKEIDARTGINVLSCYQCGKCSAGCVFSSFMDTPPSKLMRLIQLNFKERALKANTIWKCAACVTCSVRCPRQIDVLRVINTVRTIALIEKIIPIDKDTHIFDEIFFENITKHDRLNEFSAVMDFNIKTGKYFKDISLLPILLEKGKLAKAEKVHTQKIAKLVAKMQKAQS